MTSQRRLPVYLLLERDGGPTGASHQGLADLVAALRRDPGAAQGVALSVLRFGGGAEWLCTSADPDSLPDSAWESPGPHPLGEALRMLDDRLGDGAGGGPSAEAGRRPLVFLLSSRPATDDWQVAADRIKQKKAGNVIACALGPDARPHDLRRVTDIVARHPDRSPEAVRAFLEWAAQSIAAVAQGEANRPVSLPPLPAPFQLVAAPPEPPRPPPPAEPPARERPRCLPIYVMIDCAAPAGGAEGVAAGRLLEALVAELQEPNVIETGYISVIAYGKGARVVAPLTEFATFRPPALASDPDPGGPRELGEALGLLARRMNAEVRAPTPARRGDCRPIVVLLTAGAATDPWEDALERVTRTAATVHACAIGDVANGPALARLAGGIDELKDSSPEALAGFFERLGKSIQKSVTENWSEPGWFPGDPSGGAGAGAEP
jgi:uncharacterized protein YegL